MWADDIPPGLPFPHKALSTSAGHASLQSHLVRPAWGAGAVLGGLSRGAAGRTGQSPPSGAPVPCCDGGDAVCPGRLPRAPPPPCRLWLPPAAPLSSHRVSSRKGRDLGVFSHRMGCSSSAGPAKGRGHPGTESWALQWGHRPTARRWVTQTCCVLGVCNGGVFLSLGSQPRWAGRELQIPVASASPTSSGRGSGKVGGAGPVSTPLPSPSWNTGLMGAREPHSKASVLMTLQFQSSSATGPQLSPWDLMHLGDGGQWLPQCGLRVPSPEGREDAPRRRLSEGC